jgi:3-oxoacyl-[acyl-carrier protein] reductase
LSTSAASTRNARGRAERSPTSSEPDDGVPKEDVTPPAGFLLNAVDRRLRASRGGRRLEPHERQNARSGSDGLFSLAGRVALVTGGNGGLGLAIARGLRAAGATVAVTGRDRAKNAAARNEFGEAVFELDVRDEERVASVVREVVGRFGSLDVLVNNAGIYRFAPLEEVTEDEFHREFNTNVLGLLLATKEAMKHFGPDGGSVINISSIASMSPTPTAVVYSATKGAVDTITRVLAKELGPKKIRVNAINPGGVETEGTHSMGVIGSDFEKYMIERTPLGRLGQPDDITPVAVFLASAASGWMTGETIAVAGGFS